MCDKTQLRKKLLAVRAGIADKQSLSLRATELILPQLHGNVMIYLSIGSELNTDALFLRLAGIPNIHVFAPYTADGEITPREIFPSRRGDFKADRNGNLPTECYGGVVTPDKIDVCVTPLLGFNGEGYRIGYGRGCYDRFFKKAPRCEKIGLAFSAQRTEFDPEEHDVPLDRCVTEDNVIYF